ncbi:MAG: hypothetical protein PHQ23_02395, partial [Candidatus Wallbacteria bacterium]|nr:hypothetical protein [Candidatus Wallbacteria bacterium]
MRQCVREFVMSKGFKGTSFLFVGILAGIFTELMILRPDRVDHYKGLGLQAIIYIIACTYTLLCGCLAGLSFRDSEFIHTLSRSNGIVIRNFIVFMALLSLLAAAGSNLALSPLTRVFEMSDKASAKLESFVKYIRTYNTSGLNALSDAELDDLLQNALIDRNMLDEARYSDLKLQDNNELRRKFAQKTNSYHQFSKLFNGRLDRTYLFLLRPQWGLLISFLYTVMYCFVAGLLGMLIALCSDTVAGIAILFTFGLVTVWTYVNTGIHECSVAGTWLGDSSWFQNHVYTSDDLSWDRYLPLTTVRLEFILFFLGTSIILLALVDFLLLKRRHGSVSSMLPLSSFDRMLKRPLVAGMICPSSLSGLFLVRMTGVLHVVLVVLYLSLLWLFLNPAFDTGPFLSYSRRVQLIVTFFTAMLVVYFQTVQFCEKNRFASDSIELSEFTRTLPINNFRFLMTVIGLSIVSAA